MHAMTANTAPTKTVFALGSALLDQEFDVSQDEIDTLGLSIGSMALADAPTQYALFDRLTSAPRQSSGGSAANTMAALAGLGAQAFLHCVVGDDSAGDAYLADLTRLGVAHSAPKIAIPTGTCIVLIDDTGERTMQSHLGASANFAQAHIDTQRHQDDDWLYIEGYLAFNPNMSADFIKTQKNMHIALSFCDPSVVSFAKEAIQSWLNIGIDLLFCNRTEAQIFCGQDDVLECLVHLHQFAKVVVMTDGDNGAHIYDGNYLHAQAHACALKNTNGAGDNFAGGFLRAYIDGVPLDKCAYLGNLVASKVVSQDGARLSSDEYQGLYNKYLTDF